MLSFVKRIYHSLKYKFIKKSIKIFDDLTMSAGKVKYDRFLNSGERFDPSIARMVKWSDQCHIKRYEFAKLFISKNDIVLDIACGTGYGSKIISSDCKYVVGVDISNNAIQYAKKNYKSKNTQFFVSDFFENQHIADIVVSFETIEHIRCDSIQDILLQLLSYCKNTLIGSIPFREIKDNNPYHYFFNLDESDFLFLNSYGKIVFYYQSTEGEIHEQNHDSYDIQNLIFVIRKDK